MINSTFYEFIKFVGWIQPFNSQCMGYKLKTVIVTKKSYS